MRKTTMACGKRSAAYGTLIAAALGAILLGRLALVLLKRPATDWLLEERLLSDLEDPDCAVVTCAIEQLGDLRSTRAIGPVLRLGARAREHPCVDRSTLVSDDNPWLDKHPFVSRLLEAAVSRFLDRQIEESSPAAVEAVEDLILLGPDAEVLRRASAILGDFRILTPRGRTILRNLQGHEDAGVRRAAAEALEKIEAAGG